MEGKPGKAWRKPSQQLRGTLLPTLPNPFVHIANSVFIFSKQKKRLKLLGCRQLLQSLLRPLNPQLRGTDQGETTPNRALGSGCAFAHLAAVRRAPAPLCGKTPTCLGARLRLQAQAAFSPPFPGVDCSLGASGNLSLVLKSAPPTFLRLLGALPSRLVPMSLSSCL